MGSMPKWSSINLSPNTYVHTKVFGCPEGSVVGSGKINKVLGLLTKRFFFFLEYLIFVPRLVALLVNRSMTFEMCGNLDFYFLFIFLIFYFLIFYFLKMETQW